jgi:hypothetical protein
VQAACAPEDNAYPIRIETKRITNLFMTIPPVRNDGLSETGPVIAHSECGVRRAARISRAEAADDSMVCFQIRI